MQNDLTVSAKIKAFACKPENMARTINGKGAAKSLRARRNALTTEAVEVNGLVYYAGHPSLRQWDGDLWMLGIASAWRLEPAH